MGDRPAEVGSGCAGRSPVRRMRLGEVLFGPADWPVGLGAAGGRAPSQARFWTHPDWPVGVGVWTHPRLTSWRGVGPPIFGRT